MRRVVAEDVLHVARRERAEPQIGRRRRDEIGADVNKVPPTQPAADVADRETTVAVWPGTADDVADAEIDRRPVCVQKLLQIEAAGNHHDGPVILNDGPGGIRGIGIRDVAEREIPSPALRSGQAIERDEIRRVRIAELLDKEHVALRMNRDFAEARERLAVLELPRHVACDSVDAPNRFVHLITAHRPAAGDDDHEAAAIVGHHLPDR